jgi:hypothetical protein
MSKANQILHAPYTSNSMSSTPYASYGVPPVPQVIVAHNTSGSNVTPTIPVNTGVTNSISTTAHNSSSVNNSASVSSASASAYASQNEAHLLSMLKAAAADSKNKIEEDDNEDFKDLSYSDVQINLRVIQDLKEGERIMIVGGKCVQVDQRYGQSIRRYFTSDSRVRALDFIEHIIEWSKKYCKDAVAKITISEDKQGNLNKLINIQSLLTASLTGMGRFANTYSDDKLTSARIETFRSTIQTFCDEDLKKATTDKSVSRY